jgi:hypothetical protein
MFLGSRVWLVRRTDNLTAICESRLSGKCGILDVSQSCKSPRPVGRIALLFLFYFEIYGSLVYDYEELQSWDVTPYSLVEAFRLHHQGSRAWNSIHIDSYVRFEGLTTVIMC